MGAVRRQADVKSTYKLIKANSYSFPDRIHISETAKGLIKRILQTEPELRPNIDQLLSDDFFQVLPRPTHARAPTRV
jgi:polo-like kinase 1